MKISGGCHCGKITYAAEIDQEQVVICHCTDCQILSGSAYRTVAITVEDGFKLLTGQPKLYIKTAESGRKREQAFCGDCGTPIYACAQGDGPKVYGVRAGTADQRAQLIPAMQIWVRSALDWLPKFDGLRTLDKR
ncbi:MAG: GFA family protein [Alphaproteobacteria bacterium]|nr:GFA family protein [Alphaproteobacteria bacterium]